MSVAAEKYAWRKRSLKPSFKYMLLAIARHHDIRTGICSPSMKDLCVDTSMCLNTVRTNIEGLVQLDIIKLTKHEGFGQRYQYQLCGFNPNERRGLRAPTAKEREKAQREPLSPDEQGEIWNTQFNTMWGLYPRKRSKANAQRAWAKMLPTQEQYVDIIANIKDRIIGEWSDKDPQYIPHLATYLNGELWKDEPDVDPKQSMEGKNEYLKGL